MDISALYRSVGSFWDAIAPLVYAHTIALLAPRVSAGQPWHVLERIEYILSTDHYKRWRDIFDEFHLRPTMPFLIALVGLLYLALFNSILDLLSGFAVAPVSIVYSETEFWQENRPLFELAEVAAYGNSPELRIWDVYALKENYLQDFRNRYAEQYRTRIEWLNDAYRDWFTYYRLSLVFLVLSVVVLLNRWRRTENRSIYSILKHCGLILATLLAVVVSRVQAEQHTEKRLRAELLFVANQLRLDPQAEHSRMSDDDIEKVKHQLYVDLEGTDSEGYLFWWSRVLERYSIIEREFSHIADSEFEARYGYLADEASSQP